MKILGLSGSLREASHNTALLRAVGRLNGSVADFRLLPLHDIPHFNEDLEASPPAPVARLRQLVAAADAVVIASPEYNGGMTGVLKDALDWLSRPRGAAALRGKPVLTLSASPGGHGAIRAQEALRSTLERLGARLAGPPLSVAQVHLRLAGGRPDPQLDAELGELLEELTVTVATPALAAAS